METRKIITLLLALVLATGLLPVTALATDTKKVSTWEELRAALTEGGDIILDADVTAGWNDNALTIATGITATLDLNGHIVDRDLWSAKGSGYVFNIDNGSLTLTDSNPTATHDPAVFYKDPITAETVIVTGGVLTGGRDSQTGGGVYMKDGTFTMKGGSIVGNCAGDTDSWGPAGCGGGVYLQSGTFNMSGGAICGNMAVSKVLGGGKHGDGGGIYVNSGTFTLTGGEISGNEAGLKGGGVYLASTSSGHDGKIKVSGGAITGNTVAGADNNVYLEEGGVLAVTGALTGTMIGVTMQTPGVFTDGLSGNGTKENFTSDDAGLVVSLTDAGEAKLGVEEYPLWVGGVQATSANKGDILNDGGTASYDPDSNTLTLNNANITGMYQGHPLNRSIRTEDMDLTVALTGSNTVSGRIALAVYGDLTVTGGGSLTTTGSASEVIYAKGNLTIDGCDIEATAAENYAIFCCGDLTITDSNVTAASEAACAFFSSGGSLTISGDSRLFAQATDSAIDLNNGISIGEGLVITTPVGGYAEGNTIYNSGGTIATNVVIEKPTAYTVTIAEGIENGTVTADKETCEQGGTVTLTVTPAAGYVLDTLTVTDADENLVLATDNAFTMPAADVTVTATFRRIPTPPTPPTHKPVTKVTAEDIEVNVGEDGKIVLALEPEDASGYTIAYASADEKIATVKAAPKTGETDAKATEATVTGVAKGEVEIAITVTNAGGLTPGKVETVCKVKVVDPNAAAKEAVIDTIAVQEGKKTALPKYKGAKVSWKLAEGDTAAALDKKGTKVTGLTAGTETTITMHVDSLKGKGLSIEGHALKANEDYEIRLVVLAKGELVKKVSFVDEQGKKLKKLTFSLSSDAQIEQLNPVFNPTDARETKLYYVSTNPKVVTVDKDGVVKAVGAGKAKIIIYTTSLKKASVSVKVSE